MKKIIFTIILLFFIFLPSVSAQTLNQTIYGEHIESFDETATIYSDGRVKVTENIIYDFGTLSKHGIYRIIPYIKTNTEGKHFKMELTDFSVVDENGKPNQFTDSYDGTNWTIKIGNPNRTITGVHTYRISYIVSGALTYFSDHDELYWNVTGNEWTVPISQASLSVIMPSVKPEDFTLVCYTGSFGSGTQNCNVTKGSEPQISTTNGLGISQGLTAVIGFPKGLVTVLEPKEVINFSDTVFGKFVGMFFGLVFAAGFFIWYIGLPSFIIIRWYLYGRDPQGTKGEVRAWFDAPKGKGGRLLTPAEVGGLVDESIDFKDIAATFIHLAQKGYLKIVEEKKGKIFKHEEYTAVKIKEYVGDTQLQDFEIELLKGLFKKKDEVNLKDVKLYETVDTMKEDLYKGLVSQGFFPHSPEKVRKKYYVIGVVALVTFNIQLAVTAFLFGKHMPRKTLTGVEAANVGKSLRNFLSSQERQLEFQAKKQIMFEKLLPYAVAFGVEKIWAERFKDVDLKPPDWYEGDMGTFNSVVLTSHLNSSFSSFRSAATPPSSTRSSSGFSSGFSGGSSGGGGGGGGGGSW